MPYYYSLGNVPHTRHTQFRKPDGNLYAEQLFSTQGFSDEYSLLYHCHPPTVILSSEQETNLAPVQADDNLLKHRSFDGFATAPADDYLQSRVPVLFNSDVHISLAAPRSGTTDYFYKNTDADELLFIHEGTGVLHTMYGEIAFKDGDYLVIPRGTIYQVSFHSAENRLLITESFSPLRFPRRYLSGRGQLMEHAPFCERDLRPPVNLRTFDGSGEYTIRIKKQQQLHRLVYAFHPFDVVGWDGCCYPFALSIHDFEPITGRVHQPPPVHQTFEADGFVVCSFVPRLYDYHPQAVPAPYNHSNIDSDEVLYYVDGDFMSRKHVSRGMITLHPAGIPHGPHPGTVEKSIGQKETHELAVMIDCFRPLQLTKQALEIEQPDYYRSWL